MNSTPFGIPSAGASVPPARGNRRSGTAWAASRAALLGLALAGCGGGEPEEPSEPPFDERGSPNAILSDDDVEGLLESFGDLQGTRPDVWKELKAALAGQGNAGFFDRLGKDADPAFRALALKHGFPGKNRYREHLARLAAVLADAGKQADLEARRAPYNNALTQIAGSLESLRGPPEMIAEMRDAYRQAQMARDAIPAKVESLFPEADIRAVKNRLAEIRAALR